MGDPLDQNTTLGPLANKKQLETIRKQVSESIEKGAKVLYGDLDFKMQDSGLENGYFFHPMILDNITPE